MNCRQSIATSSTEVVLWMADRRSLFVIGIASLESCIFIILLTQFNQNQCIAKFY
jgi:hypothetical protein